MEGRHSKTAASITPIMLFQKDPCLLFMQQTHTLNIKNSNSFLRRSATFNESKLKYKLPCSTSTITFYFIPPTTALSLLVMWPLVLRSSFFLSRLLVSELDVKCTCALRALQCPGGWGVGVGGKLMIFSSSITSTFLLLQTFCHFSSVTPVWHLPSLLVCSKLNHHNNSNTATTLCNKSGR